ncbi:MAG: amidohydrolase family protein [Burkholderiales bacterium]|nr:amidohydrolase family protein [Burkholderiales bacterium]
MRIIDSHTHLGVSRLSESVYTEAMQLDAQRQWGIDVSIVLPIPKDPGGPAAAHDRIHRLCNDHRGRFFGVLDLDPAMADAAYWQEAQRCVKELGFIGVKLHTYFHPCNPLSPFTDKVFEMAQHFDIPVIVHTGLISTFGLPSLQVQRAKEFPRVKIVLAHMGYNAYTAEAIVAAQLCDNIFLESSWTGPGRVKEAIKKLGSARVMMGADQLINIPWELAKIRNIGLNDAQLEDCMGRTAAAVFKLPL